MNYMKLLSSIVILLTIPPFSVSLVFSILYRDAWGGGAFSIQNVLGLMLFAYMSFLLWIIYLPVMIFVPFVIPKLINSEKYKKMKMVEVFARMAMVGALGGIAVLAPAWIAALFDTAKYAEMWVVAGAIAGTITSAIIVLIYRERSSSEMDELNQGDAPDQNAVRGSPNPFGQE
jgi:hypothetical protein